MELEPGLLRRLLDATRAAIIATDADGRIVYWSRAAEELYGFAADEVVGRRDVLVAPADLDSAAEIYARLARGQSWTGEFPLRHRDGRRLTVQVDAAPVFDDEGRVIAAVGVSLDVSERVSAADALRREQELLRSTIDAAPIVLFATDGDGRFTLSRGSGLKALGLREDEVLGRSAIEIYGGLAASAGGTTTTVGDALRRALAGDAVQVHTRAGEVDFDLSITPMRDASRHVVGVIGVALDVTSRTALEQRLQQAERLEALGLLAGGVAHDFNNMLTAILGHAEILAIDLKGDRLREDVEVILHAAESAAAVTRQLLAFTRRQRQELCEVDVNESVRSLEPLLRRTVGERIELELQLMPQPATVIADPVQIEQVVLNLALNARDAMPDGGRMRISTGTAQESGDPGDDWIELAVTDTGHGMNAATRARIFEPFFTTKERGRGTGLGLASVHGIVTQTGGWIRVESEEGAGSSFRVLLPRAATATAPHCPEVRPIREPKPGRRRILLVEDEETVRTLLTTVLRRAGYEVAAHESGTTALAAARADPHGFDLVLTDVVMPGMSGPELARDLARLRPGVPIVFMSGYAEADMLSIAEQPDLQKPFTRIQLLECLARRFEG